jgi:hypothetical protein
VPTSKDLEHAQAAAAQVDWAKVDALDDAAIAAAAAEDEDNPIAEDADIAQAVRVAPLVPAKAG